jgi:flagellar assembly factor FliW
MKTDTSPIPTLPSRVELVTQFGHFTVDAREIIAFPLGVPGFEQCRRFVILSAPELAPLQCLHAVEGASVSFLVVDPRHVLPGYRCVLSQTDLVRLGAAEGDVLLWLAVVTIDASGQAFANLRAPIVINPGRMLGYQVMPHNSLYPLRHPLASE